MDRNERYERAHEKFERFNLDSWCPAVEGHEELVNVPCSERALAEVKYVKIKCVGEADIHANCDVTPGKPGAVSKFTVSQRMRVIIPIVFTADADVGEGHVCFEPCNGQHWDTDCGAGCDECEDCGDDDDDDDDDQGEDNNEDRGCPDRKVRDNYRYIGRS